MSVSVGKSAKVNASHSCVEISSDDRFEPRRARHHITYWHFFVETDGIILLDLLAHHLQRLGAVLRLLEHAAGKHALQPAAQKHAVGGYCRR